MSALRFTHSRWMKPGFISLLIIGLSLSCSSPHHDQSETETPVNTVLLKFLTPDQTGVQFANNLTETSTLNRLAYEYFYNGGGVAMGDLNNDDLPDLYFTGNLVPDRLYLNRGAMQFEDISEKAGINQFPGWSTGVSMTDINSDGLLDIYVCRSGPLPDAESRRNLCFINQGDLTFKEQAAEFGLDHDGYSVQTAFFDYDLDGDLDMYLLNHPSPGFKAASLIQHGQDIFSGKLQLDVFYENQNGTYVDQTLAADFRNFGYRHGIAVTDLDNNGYPDLFISSDFDEPDHLYMNNGDKTFSEKSKELFRHTSYFSMGNDAADINNDGLIDLITADMTPNDHKRSKENMASMNPVKFYTMTENGYHHQYMVNTLQLNRGQEHFSEIAQLAGVSKTDWSWAPLFMDIDNDGLKDLFITNGIKRDVLNNDSRATLAEKVANSDGSLFVDDLLSSFPSSIIPNALFRNSNGIKFEDAAAWMDGPAFNSNGAAFGDLDLDGDLDLVINNIDNPAAIYQNTVKSNYIAVRLIGSESNKFAVGAKVEVTTNDHTFTQEVFTSRGYLSSSDHNVIFGLADNSSIQEVSVIWPDQTISRVVSPKPNQQIIINHAESVRSKDRPAEQWTPLLTKLSDTSIGLDFEHQENNYNDFEDEVLLPHRQSRHGPMMAQADVDGDGDEDLYIGGASGQPGRLYRQTANGFRIDKRSDIWAKDAASEDLASLFFDADGDGDEDLYVVSGGIANKDQPELYRDRLYINNGQGVFKRKKNALPDVRSSGSVVKAADIDGDGDLDLFIGGRIDPGNYPLPASSQILINNAGKFTDETTVLAPQLEKLGMVTDASFSDFDQDGDDDLLIVGEWMPVTVMVNENGEFKKTEVKGLENSTGLWFSMISHDIDRDGDEDYLLGNLGLNSKFGVKGDKEFHLYAADFDQNGKLDIVLSNKYNGKLVPVRGRECSSEQMPFIAEKFESYSAFADADLKAIHGDNLDNALHIEADILESSWIERTDDGFVIHKLPIEAQMAPIQDFLVFDLTGNGQQEVMAVGNLYGAEVETVRYDASVGCILSWTGTSWASILPQESGFYTSGDSKAISSVSQSPASSLIIVTNNNGLPDIFRTGQK